MTTGTCADCGFVFAEIGPAEAPAKLRGFARRYRAPLTRFLPGEDGDTLVRRRPEPGTWSALEYAAHVRDMFAAFDRRVTWQAAGYPAGAGAVTGEPAPVAELDRVAVADELAANAERLAASLEAVAPEGWHDEGNEARSVLSTARRAVHEGNHHLLDIGRVLRAVREQAKDD
ncbi:MAG: hypothetical protein QOD63_126 [Actinomycetota bacterium]|jgi:hypothetical protein|nr:hypothetical protein [Actinomycetota bacterium]